MKEEDMKQNIQIDDAARRQAEPVVDDGSLLASRTQSTDPKDWLALLMASSGGGEGVSQAVPGGFGDGFVAGADGLPVPGVGVEVAEGYAEWFWLIAQFNRQLVDLVVHGVSV